MTPRLAIATLLLTACRQTFVAAVVDDGSGTSDPTTSPSSDSTAAACEPPEHTPCDEDGDPIHALGLACPDTPVRSSAFESVAPDAWRVCREYGNANFTATEGESMLVLTTGQLPTVHSSGQLTVPIGQTSAANDNPDDAALPPPIDPVSGSTGSPFTDCDGVGDCSDTLPGPWQAGGPAHDLVWFTFEVDVPPGVHGYRVDVAWFSVEYPRRIGEVNDLFVWWQTSAGFTGNVATYDGAATSATSLAPLLRDVDLTGNASGLVGTGYQGLQGEPCAFTGVDYDNCPNGGATGWLTLDGPAEPGEALRVVVALFDLGSDDLDTAVALDNWRWRCEGCEPGVTCGLNG